MNRFSMHSGSRKDQLQKAFQSLADQNLFVHIFEVFTYKYLFNFVYSAINFCLNGKEAFCLHIFKHSHNLKVC